MMVESAVVEVDVEKALIPADALYPRALALMFRLEEARRRGNMVDFWRAVGEIEAFARERGT